MNQNSKTDLKTLTYPLMLLSIFVLLINDHVLKIYFPSALTGKLSDFAGLFFFPILLSAVLHFVLTPFQFQSRNIALTSFGFTAIYFSLIKTIPFFNGFTENLFSIQIILDPSDLMALIMLPLAWMLREKIANESRVGVSRLSYVVLGIASLVTIATSPPVYPSVERLVVYENIIYTKIEVYDQFFYSNDGGQTWEIADFEIPEQVQEQQKKIPQLPVILCLPKNQQICYKTDTEKILESQDGEKTWRTSWEFPLGRREFFIRTAKFSDWNPSDIAYLELEGNQIVIVAMRDQGVLVKTNNGEWKSIQIGGSGPIYFSAKDFAQATGVLGGEAFFIFIVAFFFMFISTVINIKNRKLKTYYLLIICTLSSFVSSVILSASFLNQPKFVDKLVINLPHPFSAIIQYASLIIFIVSILLFIILTIQQLISNTEKPAKLNLISITFVIISSYTLFILWAYGIIPVYETTMQISIGLYILLLLWIVYLPIKEYIQAKSSRSKRDLHE